MPSLSLWRVRASLNFDNMPTVLLKPFAAALVLERGQRSIALKADPLELDDFLTDSPVADRERRETEDGSESFGTERRSRSAAR